jgi:hypothetical protein
MRRQIREERKQCHKTALQATRRDHSMLHIDDGKATGEKPANLPPVSMAGCTPSAHLTIWLRAARLELSTATPRLRLCVCVWTVAVTSLQLDTTHRGRVLRGTLVEEPVYSGSIALLLQDDAGDMVTVCQIATTNLIP